ncbi:MAG: 4Fe-4S binding protein [Moorella humiferrea]|nr:4Fe-4S binding protein [Moorella humiferrea]
MTIDSIEPKQCTGCLRCVELCPMDVLRVNCAGLPEIKYREDCQCCYLCELECPAGAILVLPERAYVPGEVYGKWETRGD